MLRDLIEYLQVERETLTWISYDVSNGNTGIGKTYFERSAAGMLVHSEYDMLDKDREYGLCSTVVVSDYYIRQIDCKTNDLGKLASFLDTMKDEYRIYSTGNSFHVYFRRLGKSIPLATYLSRLMLKDTEGLFDHRWAWHCIEDECTTLRFTQNQGVKLMIPELVLDMRFK
jgi:hypothetical protein